MKFLRVFFEVLSAIFVITALITLIYSEYKLGRAIAGLVLIALVSALTTSLLHRYEDEHR